MLESQKERKGYAKRMLNYTSEFLFSLGLQKILITCDKNNIASKRTIESCGGILENEVVEESRTTLRYWIYKNKVRLEFKSNLTFYFISTTVAPIPPSFCPPVL